MTLGLTLYRLATYGLTPLIPHLLRRRASRGKEPVGRQNERLGKSHIARPSGELIWFHGASLGESKLLLRVAAALRSKRPQVHLLFTSQTQTAAEMMAKNLPENAMHQLAPIDTPHAAMRFLDHWAPQLCIFAEGEIWPNLIMQADTRKTKLALINARMTERSLTGWAKWPDTAAHLFSSFDLILAADTKTAKGLSELSRRCVVCPGNLKAAMQTVPESISPSPLTLPWSGPVLLGASTHSAEEALLLDTLTQLPDKTRLILAPRHPERADEISRLLKSRRVSFAKRSEGAPITADTKILLADTIGEMDTWYTLSDHIYIGGAHAPDIGGHNPLEPLAHGKAAITGPFMTNFADISSELSDINALRIVSDANELARAIKEDIPMDQAEISAFFATGRRAMQDTVEALIRLLEQRPDR